MLILTILSKGFNKPKSSFYLTNHASFKKLKFYLTLNPNNGGTWNTTKGVFCLQLLHSFFFQNNRPLPQSTASQNLPIPAVTFTVQK